MSRKHVVHDQSIITLGALGAKASATVATKIDGTRLQGVKLDYIMAQLSFNNKTTLQGPIVVGLAYGLTAAEIDEAMVADPQHIVDVPAKEQSDRAVFPVWMIGTVATGDDVAVIPIRKINFLWKEIAEGRGLHWFAFNAGAGGLTTGTVVLIESTYVGEWLRD